MPRPSGVLQLVLHALRAYCWQALRACCMPRFARQAL